MSQFSAQAFFKEWRSLWHCPSAVGQAGLSLKLEFFEDLFAHADSGSRWWVESRWTLLRGGEPVIHLLYAGTSEIHSAPLDGWMLKPSGGLRVWNLGNSPWPGKQLEEELSVEAGVDPLRATLLATELREACSPVTEALLSAVQGWPNNLPTGRARRAVGG